MYRQRTYAVALHLNIPVLKDVWVSCQISLLCIVPLLIPWEIEKYTIFFHWPIKKQNNNNNKNKTKTNKQTNKAKQKQINKICQLNLHYAFILYSNSGDSQCSAPPTFTSERRCFPDASGEKVDIQNRRVIQITW